MVSSIMHMHLMHAPAGLRLRLRLRLRVRGTIIMRALTTELVHGKGATHNQKAKAKAKDSPKD